MKTDIILGGVGGQGILSIAAVIGSAALFKNLNIKQSEVHGMSQRGGAVYSHLRISDKPVASDLIPMGGADLIISVEPMESLRYLSYLKPEGWLISNSKTFINITDYPEQEKIFEEIRCYKNHILIDADEIAKKIKTARSSNMVMVGAAAPFMNLSAEELENGIERIFASKGEEIVKINIESFRKGLEFSMSNK
jgi:indolepyruvate ferredoxin oxidoreductase beta subunit